MGLPLIINHILDRNILTFADVVEQKDVDLFATTDDGYNCIHRTAGLDYHPTEMLQILFKQEPNLKSIINSQSTDKAQTTPLSLAILSDNYLSYKFLMEQGAIFSFFVENGVSGSTPLSNCTKEEPFHLAFTYLVLSLIEKAGYPNYSDEVLEGEEKSKRDKAIEIVEEVRGKIREFFEENQLDDPTEKYPDDGKSLSQMINEVLNLERQKRVAKAEAEAQALVEDFSSFSSVDSVDSISSSDVEDLESKPKPKGEKHRILFADEELKYLKETFREKERSESVDVLEMDDASFKSISSHSSRPSTPLTPENLRKIEEQSISSSDVIDRRRSRTQSSDETDKSKKSDESRDSARTEASKKLGADTAKKKGRVTSVVANPNPSDSRLRSDSESSISDEEVERLGQQAIQATKSGMTSGSVVLNPEDGSLEVKSKVHRGKDKKESKSWWSAWFGGNESKNTQERQGLLSSEEKPSNASSYKHPTPQQQPQFLGNFGGKTAHNPEPFDNLGVRKRR